MKPSNFQDNIHRVDYLTPYAEPLLDAAGWCDLAGRERESLDGDWHFAIDPYDTCLRARWFEERYADAAGRALPVDFSFDQWGLTPVPSCWNVQDPAWLWYEGSAVYVRDVTFGAGQPGERVFLDFGGAAATAYVFLNGDYLGRHVGASTPFCVEVTGRLGATNRLVVVVNNTRRADQVPTDNTDWFNYGGLHRSVALVRVPASFVARATVGLVPDGTYSQIEVEVTTDGAELGEPVQIAIADLGLAGQLAVVDGQARGRFALSPELWSPAHPRLYDVVVSYGADLWRDRIGFRQIRVVGNQIELNGQPIFLKGVCQHEESVEHGRSLSEAEIRQNLGLAKQMGCVFMRLAHYPHAGLTARLADELGMLLWEEVAVYWAVLFDSDAVLSNAQNQLRELMRRDRNRASVIVWSVGNENADSEARLRFMSALVDTARAEDPTRLVSAACLVDPSIPAIADRLAERLDIIGLNEYYGWYEPDFDRLVQVFANSAPTKPVVVTEFGADAVAGLRGEADQMFTEDNQLAIYTRQIEVLSSIEYVRGTTPWILYDFRCPRRAHVRQGYYNRKGLLSADKQHRKLAFEAMRAWYARLG